MKNINKQLLVLNVALALVVVVLSVKLVSNQNLTSSVSDETQTGMRTKDFHSLDVMTDFGNNPFTFFTGHGLLLCAGDHNGANAMTIGWGALGTLWGKPSVTVYVRHGRYTHKFMESGKYFTVMKFNDNRVVDYMGTHSGRDGDKAKALGLHIAYTHNGAPYYKEAEMVIECRTMSANDFRQEGFRDEVPRKIYADGHDSGGMHTEYIGEVVSFMKQK